MLRKRTYAQRNLQFLAHSTGAAAPVKVPSIPSKPTEGIFMTVSIELISNKIHFVRGKAVMLDQDLARLYGVQTKHLNRQVKRNRERFPEDFMFQLTPPEVLRCQNVTLKKEGRGQHRKYLPYVFTEQGVAMLSSVLNSPLAIQVNIQIMRAFVAIKRMSLTYAALKKKIQEMEKKYDVKFRVVFEAIEQIIQEMVKADRRLFGSNAPQKHIGFHKD